MDNKPVVNEEVIYEQLNELQKSNQPDELVVIPRLMFNYLVVALVFLGVGVFIGTNYIGNNNVDEDSIARVVRSVLSEYDFSGDETVNARALVDDDPYLGDEDAPIVIVEFSDYLCGFCKRHHDTTFQEIMDNYGQYIRYVVRDFAQLGPESYSSALAAQCANEQGAFWDFHNEFFDHQELLGLEFYISIAEEYELDMDAFTTCFEENRYQEEINFDFVDGQINGVAGTPGFFINGNFVRGAQPYMVFDRYIQVELSKAGIEYTPPERSPSDS